MSERQITVHLRRGRDTYTHTIETVNGLPPEELEGQQWVLPNGSLVSRFVLVDGQDTEGDEFAYEFADPK